MPQLASTPTPFTLHVEDRVLDDLRERLARTRWPDEAPGAPWSTGSSVAYMKALAEYWHTGFDWRAQEAGLNRFRQFKVPLAGIELHFIHEPGRGPAPLPLLLSHGWPGSVFEFRRLIPMLTDPARFGGDPADAFTVVAPSLPGFTLLFQPGQARFGVEEMADAFAALMTDVLGYPRFATQGGDWGSFVASRLGYSHPERVIGIHLNLLAVRRDPQMLRDPTDEERLFLAELKHFLKEETGYQWIQGTKPQTLAFGLNDSPAGLAAWIVEKFRSWTDNDGDPAGAVPHVVSNSATQLALQRLDAVEQTAELLSEGGDAVLHARRHLGVAALVKNAVAHQLGQPFVEDLLRQAVDAVLKRAGATDAAAHRADHRQRPFAAHDVLDHACHGRGGRRVAAVGGRG
ncbi:MAG: epoxide hydrolase [Caldimonas sp.]